MAERVKYGIYELLEAEADRLIAESLEGVTSREAKSDILTPWKLKHRKTHEILTRTGAAVDPAVRQGQFTRAYNPVQTWLNSYDGATRPIRMDSQWDPEQTSASVPLSESMAIAVGVDRYDY
jgi:hypothetical protein